MVPYAFLLLAIGAPDMTGHSGPDRAAIADAAQIGGPRRLAVLVDAPARRGDYALPWLVIDANGSCSAVCANAVDRPILLTQIEPGKVAVALVPGPGLRPAGLSAAQAVLVKENGLTVVRLRAEEVRGSRVDVRILTADGNAATGLDVVVRDVTREGLGLDWRTCTDAEGRLSFYAFPGRAYQLRSRIAIPQLTELELRVPSPPPLEPLIWRLGLGPILDIMFLRATHGTREPFRELQSINVVTSETRCNLEVTDGRLRLRKESSLLKGAQELSFDLANSRPGSPVFGYEITDGVPIRIDETPLQRVEVRIGRAKQAKITVTGQLPGSIRGAGVQEGTAYLVEAPSGRIATAIGCGLPMTARPGRYEVLLWRAGFLLARQGLAVEDTGDILVDLPLVPAPVLKAVVVGQNRQVLMNAAVQAVCASRQYLRTGVSLSGPDGSVRLPVDPHLAMWLLVRCQGYGTQLFPVGGQALEGVQQLELRSPCKVTARLVVDPAVPPGEVPSAWSLRWADQRCPELIIGGASEDQGVFMMHMPPGIFALHAYRLGRCISMGEVEVREGEHAKDLGSLRVTTPAWETAVLESGR